MPTPTEELVRQADARFIAALLAGDAGALDTLLDEGFVIIEIGSGEVHPRADFVSAVAQGLVAFQAIETDPAASLVRDYGDAAIVVGRTEMTIADPAGATMHASSRYTHVFVRRDGAWQLASAQGTPITAE